MVVHSVTAIPSRSKHLNIIGISAGFHDSACSLIQDGVLTAAAQEERFTRIKHDRSFPRNAFRFCLEHAGITISDVACIGYYEEPEQKLSRQIWMSLLPELSAARREALVKRMHASRPEEVIRLTLGYEGPVELFDHHLSHAASSYYFSGFDEAAVLTVDGVGDWATTTYGAGAGKELTRFEQVDFPDSLGLLYSTITGYLGFEVNEGEYKVMGLAPYGEPRYVDQLRRLVQLSEAGQYRLDTRYFAFFTADDRMYSDELPALFGQPPREPESELQQFHKDLARSMQVVLEEILLEKANYLYSKVPSENLCMAGGVALNCVANSRILSDGPFKQLFVQPAAGDAGGSLGAAALAHVRLTGSAPERKKLQHVYLGPEFSYEEAQKILRATSASFRDYRGREAELITFTASQLAEGKVIGWFQGRMEFGPRSLGARSILADPRLPQMRDRINALVKMREAFRPFAPAVLEDETQNHFQLDHSSPFMLETCQVTSTLNLGAITHVDGSARVQTVDAATNGRFAALLREFFKRTGCPILLNTSFNMRGEPIVCNIVDAIKCFVRSRLDLLIIEDFVLERSGIPSLWQLFAALPGNAAGRADSSVSTLVYTLL